MTRPIERVLLTGAGGFVGHHTLEHLLVNTDWHVVCTDSFRHAGKTDRIREVIDSHVESQVMGTGLGGGAPVWVETRPWRDRVTVVTHDLTAPFSDQLRERIGPVQAIVSMASESHVDHSISDPVPFVENNVSLVLNLLELARSYDDPPLFLQVSTDEVYGPAYEGHDHREWEPAIPSNPYSASKAAQEAICISYWRTYGVPLVLTNTMNIIGERQDPEKFMPMVIKRVLEGRVVQVHGSPGGRPGSRYYLHARNQADALLYLLRFFTDGVGVDEEAAAAYETGAGIDGESLVWGHGAEQPPRFHVVGEREVDNLEMAELIASHVPGRELHAELVDFHSSRPGHDLRYALDGSKMASIGWSAPFPLEETIRRTVEWTLGHPEWLL